MTNLNRVLLASLILMSGCATSPKTVNYYDVPSAALKNIREMQHLPDSALLDSRYVDLGVVSGSTCHQYETIYSGSSDTNSDRKVFEQLVLSASQLGALHITTPHCVVLDSTEPYDNCAETLECVSHALQELTAEQISDRSDSLAAE